jgi:hypothetical protein
LFGNWQGRAAACAQRCASSKCLFHGGMQRE